DPMAAKALMRMMELQTRQNVVEMLAASGTINQFTLEELGLKEVASEIPEVEKLEAPADASPGEGGNATVRDQNADNVIQKISG
ncbi:MAG: hypothetical protein AAGB25_04760, partial [Pseudomonadota bacterium]